MVSVKVVREACATCDMHRYSLETPFPLQNPPRSVREHQGLYVVTFCVMALRQRATHHLLIRYPYKELTHIIKLTQGLCADLLEATGSLYSSSAPRV